MTDELALRRAWKKVKCDCGCPDIYFCPTINSGEGEIECPRHGGFDTCCSRPDLHVVVVRRGNTIQPVTERL